MNSPEAHFAEVMKLRDAARVILQRSGKWQTVHGTSHRLWCAQEGRLRITLRTPFQPLPPAPSRVKYYAAMQGRRVDDLPYGLDIWAPMKVLSLQWDNEGDFEIIGFTHGPWEADLLHAGLR